MKRIIINGRFLIHKVTGVERYARELLSRLDEMVQPGSIEMAVPPETENIPEYKNITVTRAGRLHNILWEHISFPSYVRKKGAVSLNLCNVAPLASPGIVCIHDVKVKARPGDFSTKFRCWYNLLMNNSTKRAKKIITVSEFSKSEICRYYDVEPQRICVIPDAWQHFERTGFDEDALEKYGLCKDGYMFAMASLEPNKNFRWIAQAAKANKDKLFAIAGSINEKVFADGLGFDLPENVKLLGYVSDKEAKTLMRDCEAFLFPSFYEGFGIPPLEALSAGARSLVVSDTQVMHEVLGDGVEYVDVNDFDADLSSIKKLTEEQRTLILNKYSWRDSAQKLYDLISGDD